MQTAILQQMAAGVTQGASQKKSSGGRAYDLHDQAAIMGWCGVRNISQVPRIWGLWAATSNLKTQRTDLMRGMGAWATATRRSIEEPFFSETVIKEDVSLKPNPGTALADYDLCDRGESPLACLSSTTANRINQTLLEEARTRAKDVLEMVHSFKKCGPEKELPPQVRMKVVGFTGDRGPNQKPTPVIPPSANMWRWKEVEFATHEVAFASFHSTPGNSEKLWAPTTQKIQKKMPRALRLPLAHVDWFAEQPRTCHEYYAFLAGQMI